MSLGPNKNREIPSCRHDLDIIRERLDNLLTWGELDDRERAAVTEASNLSGKACHAIWLLEKAKSDRFNAVRRDAKLQLENTDDRDFRSEP